MQVRWIDKADILKYLKRLKALSMHPAARAVFMLLVITIMATIVVELFEANQNNQFTSYWDSVWWVFVTITTVGYGDKVPVTPAGKILGVIIMFVGIALLSIITATISSIFVTRKIKEGKGLQDIKTKDHILICGWNSDAEQILDTLELSDIQHQEIIMINQLSEEAIDDIISHHSSIAIKFVRGDFTKESILNRANAKFAGAALVLPDESVSGEKMGDEKTILATLSLKAINPKIKVYVHILDRENIPHLTKARADEIIVSDAYTGFLMANYVTYPGIPQLVLQLCSPKSANKLKRRILPNELIGKSFKDLKSYYYQKYSGVLLGIGQMTQPFDLSDLMKDDTSSLDDFIKRKFQEAGRGIGSNEQVKIQINPADETNLSKNDFYLSIERTE